MPLAVSATTLIGTDVGRVDEAHDMVGERVEEISFGASARRCGTSGTVAVEHTFGHGLHVSEAGVDADRPCAGQTQLDAVVARRVVRCGEHGTGHVEHARGVVHEIRRGEADVDDIDALLHHSPSEGIDEFGPGRPHVACDDHLVGGGERGESDSECVRDLSVELVGNGASDVVGLDDLVED